VIEKKCCPIWAIVTAVVVLVSIGVVVYCVLKKLNLLGCCCEDGCCSEESGLAYIAEAKDENGVPYTTDKDFV